uniref:SGNH hydrolase-type esterase domain-containing protein n=1 Tax=Tanacetum cinerariifolium TaxID=118510 RepID=A0A6L2JP33_TANCI|nr:SGNH hydrolase-type esterase domain-containing protein [Tanacetum cinerariifolium]
MNEFLVIQIHNNLSSKSAETHKSLYSTLDEKYDGIAYDFPPELEFLLASESHTVVPLCSLDTFEEEYKVESEVFNLLKIDVHVFTYDTPLGMIFNEFSRLSSMEDDLFTYEQFEEYMEIKRRLEVDRVNTDLEFDPTNVEFAKWLASKFNNHNTMDRYKKNALWLYWIRGDDEEVLTSDKFSDLEEENLHKEWFDDHKLMGDDDDDIGNLDDYLTPKDAPYYVDEEEEGFKERMSKLLGIPYMKHQRSNLKSSRS